MQYDLVQLDRQPTAVVRGVIAIPELPAFFGRAFGEIFRTIGEQAIAAIGPPFAFYSPEPADVVELEAGVAIAGAVQASGSVVPSELPGGRAAVAIHVGPYEELERTYRELMAAITEQGLVMRPIGMWEEYLTDPDSEPDPSRWRTRVVIPVED